MASGHCFFVAVDDSVCHKREGEARIPDKTIHSRAVEGDILQEAGCGQNSVEETGSSRV
jgi:hypothetical protein